MTAKINLYHIIMCPNGIFPSVRHSIKGISHQQPVGMEIGGRVTETSGSVFIMILL